MKKIFEYAGKFRYLTIVSWILSAISAWTTLVPLYYIWRVLKEVIESRPDFSKAENISHYGWMAVEFSLFSMVIYVGALMCSHMAAFRIQANIRSQTMKHIITLPMGFLDMAGSGRIRRIVNESSAATETYLAHQLPDKAGAIATPIGVLVLLLLFDWRLGLLCLVPIITAFAVMGTMTGSKMKEKMQEYNNALEEMSNEAVEYVRGIPVVKTFGQSVFSFKKFKSSIDNYGKWTIAYTKALRIPMVLYTAIINSVFVILIVAAIVMTSDGVTNEFILNITFYIILAPIITVTLNKIMHSSKDKMVVEDALNRIDGIMNMKPLEEAKEPEKIIDNSIVFENVSFCYPEANKDAIKNVSLEIKKGEHIAFVGPSGGGKTTLASLVARFFDVTEGRILVGGADVRKVSSKELMENVSFVFQDSKLLKMSIYENVRLGKPNATREMVMQVLIDAQCEDIINKFPEGIDTVIGSKGIYVSGGEAQRLAIARAMLKNSPIIILDEATAFADPDNETRVQAAFAKLSEGRTVIMIAHRLSTVIEADNIFVLKEGEIVEQGNHYTLLKKNGIYSHMWQEYNKSVNWKVGD